MAIILFMSRTGRDFPVDLFKVKPGYVWFIEHPETGRWWGLADDWTDDPNQALSFPTNIAARTSAVEKNIVPFIITEHEFIDFT